MSDELLDIFRSRWFWVTAGCLAAACVGLLVAYYIAHPDRSSWEDFQRRGAVDIPSTNGHVAHAEARHGIDLVEGLADSGTE